MKSKSFHFVWFRDSNFVLRLIYRQLRGRCSSLAESRFLLCTHTHCTCPSTPKTRFLVLHNHLNIFLSSQRNHPICSSAPYHQLVTGSVKCFHNHQVSRVRIALGIFISILINIYSSVGKPDHWWEQNERCWMLRGLRLWITTSKLPSGWHKLEDFSNLWGVLRIFEEYVVSKGESEAGRMRWKGCPRSQF